MKRPILCRGAGTRGGHLRTNGRDQEATLAQHGKQLSHRTGSTVGRIGMQCKQRSVRSGGSQRTWARRLCIDRQWSSLVLLVSSFRASSS